jgi:hypothetical protein
MKMDTNEWSLIEKFENGCQWQWNEWRRNKYMKINVMEQQPVKNVSNGRESTVNRALDGSTYLG